MCKKKAFTSVMQARKANVRAPFRIRVYRCGFCNMLHVTNQEKL